MDDLPEMGEPRHLVCQQKCKNVKNKTKELYKK